jgi:hypothetical protein
VSPADVEKYETRCPMWLNFIRVPAAFLPRACDVATRKHSSYNDSYGVQQHVVYAITDT